MSVVRATLYKMKVAQRSIYDPYKELQQHSLSPEKRYINSRLDVKTFLSEQLSVEPRQVIIEEKARQIKDIILMKQLIKFNEYEIDDTLRGDE